mmetsp:Transcript_14553/g.52384  ORF Transcript_14553/g.52384 Transcript_14553/m.52384 type:complete len:225 (-) Transcript_14553:238-912(-)
MMRAVLRPRSAFTSHRAHDGQHRRVRAEREDRERQHARQPGQRREPRDRVRAVDRDRGRRLIGESPGTLDRTRTRARARDDSPRRKRVRHEHRCERRHNPQRRLAHRRQQRVALAADEQPGREHPSQRHRREDRGSVRLQPRRQHLVRERRHHIREDVCETDEASDLQRHDADRARGPPAWAERVRHEVLVAPHRLAAEDALADRVRGLDHDRHAEPRPEPREE